MLGLNGRDGPANFAEHFTDNTPNIPLGGICGKRDPGMRSPSDNAPTRVPGETLSTVNPAISVDRGIHTP